LREDGSASKKSKDRLNPGLKAELIGNVSLGSALEPDPKVGSVGGGYVNHCVGSHRGGERPCG
jgi:hypothetical protein